MPADYSELVPHMEVPEATVVVDAAAAVGVADTAVAADTASAAVAADTASAAAAVAHNSFSAPFVVVVEVEADIDHIQWP